MFNDELTKRIAALSPEKRAIFEQKLKQINSPQKPTITKRTDLNSSPLSFAQERLWFLHQLDPSNAAYHIPIAWHFTGQLNLQKLHDSINLIIQRHEALRTRFPTKEGKPYQDILNNLILEIPVIHLAQEQVKQFTKEEAQRPFNLETGPLLRITLLQLSPQESILLVIFHHIIADGWSRGIFLKELMTLYKSESQLPELPIQYVDFADWQRNWLTGEERQIQLDYWKQQLTDLPVLNLPTDLPRPPVQTFRGSTQNFTLSKDLNDSLKQLSRQQGVTLFMTLLTAFNILLHRYSGQDDLVIGSPIANRNWTETEGLIGFFVNTLILRNNLSGNPTFLELLKKVKEVTSGAYKHQDLPFAFLVEELQPERNLSHNPLFGVMFQFQNEAYQLQNSNSPELAIPNLKLEQYWIEPEFTKFDLTWHLIERETGILGVIEYSTDLFKTETITRMFQHFQQLLLEIITNPQKRLSELTLLSPTEQHQLLIEWNNTKTDETLELVHQLIEKQTQRTPNNIAVVCGNQKLTYQELNQKANQLAHHLQILGVKPETLVGICFKRSLEMVIAILGILKAGGAYVPLDSTYPQERLAYMLDDANIFLLLTQTELLEILPKNNCNILCLDNHQPVEIENPNPSPNTNINANNLAYVIYTSGSTGKPKGTLLTHRGLINYLTWAIQEYKVSEGEGSPVQSSIGFDATITSLYTPLLVGKTVVLLPEEQELEVLNTDHHYSLLKITPAHLGILSQFPQKAQTNALIIGGEALFGNHLTFWQHQTPNTRLINEYGPTETVVGCCVYEVQKPVTGLVPIGKAIANTQLYILDRYLQPVPIGVPGELYIGGAGVARGYLNRPDLTADKFIPNPFSSGRLYKTGDQARYLSDGNIEYLGRLDEQVKIRGFRIELGEIEAVLAQHPDITEALVTVHEDTQGNKRLVAYLVSSTPQNLRDFLKSKLPDYMIPSAFIPLTTFPLTANGKINRNALPSPDLTTQTASLVLPRTANEEILAQIWAEVLGRESISIHDNFFELGGDSILSIQIIAKVNQKGLKITPKQLFEHQTIALLAAVAQTVTATQIEQGIVIGNVPLTPIQEWFFKQNLIEPHHYNQSVLLELSPQIQPQLLKQVIQELLIHHDALRLRFTLSETGWQQFNIAPDENIPLTIVDLSGQPKEKIEEIATQIQASLNLTDGPIFRGVWFNFGQEQSSYLLLVIHHLAVDGVSWRILLEDLATGYQQLINNQKIQLPAKTTSYKDWANYLIQFSDLRETTNNIFSNLPVDYSNGDNTIASTAQIITSLTVEETQALLKDIPQVYQTQINDVLLTALAQAFTQWTGHSDLLVDLESYGRDTDEFDISRTVGWFTTIIPLYLDLTNLKKLEDSLKSIKEQLRRSSLKMNSSFQSNSEVIFNYLGQLDRVQSSYPILSLVNELQGARRSFRQNRCYLLEVNTLVIEDKLQVNWIYSKNIHQQKTIQNLANNYITALKTIITHCQTLETKVYTPSDFSAAKLEQKQLDQFLNKINKRK